MKPPCLTCCIHKDNECKLHNVFCNFFCKARIRYALYIERRYSYRYEAVNHGGDRVFARGVIKVEDEKLLQTAYL